jgi:shikimate kinase
MRSEVPTWTRPDSCVLIGPRCSGKTSLGRVLAEHLGWRSWDGDAEFERRWGVTVGDWLRGHGEAAFRRHEAEITLELLAAARPFVAALGGGAVLSEAVRHALRAHRVVVLLLAAPEVLAARIAASAIDRPPLTAKGAVAEVADLLAARMPCYQEAATMQVDTSSGDVSDWLQALLASAGLSA